MKLYELMEVMDNRDRGYITVKTEAGSAVCFDCGPGFIHFTFKDRNVVRVEPCVSVGKDGSTAHAGIMVIIDE